MSCLEIWVGLKGLENKYLISNLGRVKSLERKKIKTREGKTYPVTIPEKIISQTIKKSVSIFKANGKTYSTGRMVYLSFNPTEKLGPGEVIYKKNKIPSDNRLVNLVRGTRKESRKIDVKLNRVSIEKSKASLKKANAVRSMLANASIKTCSKCGITQPSEEFYRGKICRECTNSYQRAYKKTKR